MFVFAVLMLEIITLSLLLLPMPNNAVRGLISKGLKAASDNQRVKQFFIVCLVVISLLFLDAMRTINHLDEEQDKGDRKGPHLEFAIKLRLFRNQRNAYITGFSLFLMLVIYRVTAILAQLHRERAANKAALKNAASEPKKEK